MTKFDRLYHIGGVCVLDGCRFLFQLFKTPDILQIQYAFFAGTHPAGESGRYGVNKIDEALHDGDKKADGGLAPDNRQHQQSGQHSDNDRGKNIDRACLGKYGEISPGLYADRLARLFCPSLLKKITVLKQRPLFDIFSVLHHILIVVRPSKQLFGRLIRLVAALTVSDGIDDIGY